MIVGVYVVAFFMVAGPFHARVQGRNSEYVRLLECEAGSDTLGVSFERSDDLDGKKPAAGLHHLFALPEAIVFAHDGSNVVEGFEPVN